ncbi:MAG: hypothetical protein HKN47_09320 [Pirellulaceae bacterium]|nr:hypothetical protein [Pirellulaceae bacterium]
MRFPKLRFSIRTVLVVTAVAALATFWIVTPTVRARQFAAAIDERDHDRFARQLRLDTTEDARAQLSAITGGCELEPWTWQQLIGGTRYVMVWRGWAGGDRYEVGCVHTRAAWSY